MLEEQRRLATADGVLYYLAGSDAIMGVCKVLQGHISDGIYWIEKSILQREKEGYQTIADWYRLFLCDVYLQIIGGSEKLPFGILLKDLPILLNVMVTASSRIRALTTRIMDNPHFDPTGFHFGRVQMILGLLYKIKQNRALALEHLIKAKRILSQFGQTPILARVEAALAELGQ